MDLSIFENKLIIFEGGDSTGKSSVAQLFYEDLKEAGMKVIHTLQPGGNWGPMASTFRALCKDRRFNINSYTNLFIFLADRSECIEKIVKPALDSGKTVISDRWSYSTVAYQLYGKGMLDDFKKFLNSDTKVNVIKEWIENSFFNIDPDYTFYFPEKIGNREKDIYDNFDQRGNLFEERVRNAYNEMSRRLDWIEVSPGTSSNETLTNLYNKVSWRNELI